MTLFTFTIMSVQTSLNGGGQEEANLKADF
jgi:hypothetical protein